MNLTYVTPRLCLLLYPDNEEVSRDNSMFDKEKASDHVRQSYYQTTLLPIQSKLEK